MLGVKILIIGVVQGTGFRPFIYHLAQEFGFTGYVQNTPVGVSIVLPYHPDQVHAFVKNIWERLPPLAKVENILTLPHPLQNGFDTFTILPSTPYGKGITEIPPDHAICPTCLKDIFTPESKYYLYPYTSCTCCGPRYSVIQQTPYDKDTTTLSIFTLCTDCKEAYTKVTNRRYHAQTIACSQCGPQLSHPLTEISDALHNSKIVALKNQTGFRLLLDAFDVNTIKKLRKAKKRPYKPFALMALNVKSIEHYAYVSNLEREALESSTRPIVLLRKKKEGKTLHHVAPHNNTLGFMLPNSGLDFLLFYYLLGQPKGLDWLEVPQKKLLIVTSANIVGESLISENDQAYKKLSHIADLIVNNNYKIAMKSDDSIMHLTTNKMLLLRRARGIAPSTIKMSEPLPSVLATGAFLKNTFCAIQGTRAFLSQYIGDMDNQDTLAYYHQVLHHYQHIFQLKYEGLACDKHPDIYTTQFAQTHNLPIYRVQHHEAHLAAVIAEHHIDGRVIGLTLDGFGLGEDGIARGGELYVFDSHTLAIQRKGSLLPIPYCGGDSVAKAPWKMALALCVYHHLEIPEYLIQHQHALALQDILKNNLSHLPVTTSMGRIFDGISSLLNICHINTYEGQAAIELETFANNLECNDCLFQITKNNQLDLNLLMRAVIQCTTKHQASNLWHGTLSLALVQWVYINAQQWRTNKVVLGGGCFQNKILLNRVWQLLQAFGLYAYISEQVPVNDGGISLGQAWLAANYIKQGRNTLCA
jgi:hydrogenase maturation protein HypF